MAYEYNATVLRCDYRSCRETLAPAIPMGRRDLRRYGTDKGWCSFKRGQWTDLCPQHATQADFDRRDL